MVRASVFVFFCIASLLQAAHGGKLDPAFEKVPFEKWLAEGKGAPFHWSAKVPRPQLSFHQRLLTSVDIELDGRDLQTRRRDGELVFFVQITDSEGIRYQDHDAVKLEKLSEDIKAANVEYSERLFVLPGDYHLSVAILDTGSGEHSTVQRALRIPPPAGDFFLRAWRDLPPVEFVGPQESPDSWFLPKVDGKLQWATAVRKPAQLNILLNAASSALTIGGRQTPSAGLAALLPTLKALTQTGSTLIAEQVRLLDLSRKVALYRQDQTRELDWPALKASLAKASTASIDVHSLGDQHHDAQFFVSQVRNVLRESQGTCVLVVLTTPIAFASGEDLTPISLEALPPCQIFYVRYSASAFADRPLGQFGGRGRGMRMGGPRFESHGRPAIVDQLAGTLKPLNPKIFDVETPDQITKVFAEVARVLF